MRTTRTLLPAVVLAVATLATACGGTSSGAADAAPEPPVTSTIDAATTTSSSPAPEPAAHDTVVARADSELDVFAAPGDAAPTQILPATTEFGSTRALVVEAVQGDWLQVLLPTRPNGSTGWIRGDQVELRVVDEAVVVDLEARTLTVTVAGEVVLETTVAIGTAESPTPTGRFSIVDKLATGAPDGPYGEFAIGLSGHSDVLTEFAGGDGQIGIHGTNDPSSIGLAASHGCVRVPNDVAVALDDLLPLGTPVTIL